MNFLSRAPIGVLSLFLLSATVLEAGVAVNIRTGETNTDLQTVIDNAEQNDVLELEGTFLGNFHNDEFSLIFRGKHHHLATLDGGNNGPVFIINDDGGDRSVTVVFEHIKFTNGLTDDDGGGIDNTEGTHNNVILKSCEVKGNTAFNGGGIANTGVLTIIDSEIERNTANGTDSDGNGGGIYLVPGSGATLLVVESEIKKNNANENGGGVYSNNNIASSEGNLTQGISFVDSEVENNSANNDGGGLYARNTVYSIRGTEFKENTASGEGGAVNDGGGIAFIAHSNFNSNTATGNGGGFFGDTSVIEAFETHFEKNTSLEGVGGGIYSDFCVINLSHSEIERNSAAQGGGIFSIELSNIYLSHVEIERNEALTGAGGGIFNDSGSTLTVEHSELKKNIASDFGGGLYNNATAGFFKSEIDHNEAGNDGGGIFNDIDGILNLTETTVEDNDPNDISGPGTVND